MILKLSEIIVTFTIMCHIIISVFISFSWLKAIRVSEIENLTDEISIYLKKSRGLLYVFFIGTFTTCLLWLKVI